MSVDPITVEIIRCALKAAANEMSAVLKKTAYNMMIYEVQDYCVAVLDHEGRTMSQNEGALPIFLADLGVAVQDGIEVVRQGQHPSWRCLLGQSSGDLRPASKQHGGLHAVFSGKASLMCFLAVRAHWIDVGGGSTGFGSSNTRDVYEEGLQVRSVKIYKQGQPNTEVLRLIEDNIRFPESSFGDLRAQIACCRTGEERLEQICQKYGGARFQDAVAVIWEQTDKLVRAAVRAIPTASTKLRRF
jgi:N-methylhydantoinase B